MITPVMPTYARADLAFSHGKGAEVWTDDGRRFLDFGAGIAVNALGHTHPHLVETLKAQADKLWHTSNLFRIPDGERLAKRLVDATFADTVFFTNSGAEANEGAIKTARKYQAVNGHPNRYRLITFEGAFHGRTLATIAAGGQQKYLDGFGPKADGFDQVPFGDHKALEKIIGPDTAAIMIEPIQGEGGIRTVPPEELRYLRDLCDRHDLLLIYDEIQTGVGRTGKLFAHEWAGDKALPDIMTIAKGIGGGFPMGAFLCTEKAAKGMVAGTHGTTFGGNPMAMAIGNAVLDVVLADGFLETVRQRGLKLKQALAGLVDRYPSVFSDVRGAGLMMGLKCVPVNTEVNAAIREAGLLTIPAGDNVIRLLPPLTITDADIKEAVEKIETAAKAIIAKGTGA